MIKAFVLVAPLLVTALPLAAQPAADVPGDPKAWFAQKQRAGAPRQPQLSAIAREAADRARWSTTTKGCAPIRNVELYRLQPATADRLVSEGLKAGAFAGAWTFYGATGCAKTPLLRYLYIAEADGGHLLLVVNRGEAIATPSQMRETSEVAARAAYDKARARVPGCAVTSVGMRQTRIAATDGNLSPMQFGTRFAGGWSEAWDFVACGYDATVTVRFDSDGTGGARARIAGVELR